MLNSYNNKIEVIKMKKLVYHIIYMDNGCCTCDDDNSIDWVYIALNKTFPSCQFGLQQFHTNVPSVQASIDDSLLHRLSETIVSETTTKQAI